MFRIALSAALSTLTIAAVAAPADCIKIASDLDRLACYDREAGRIPRITERPKAGEWSIWQSRSKMTDQEDVRATLASDEIIDCGWNKGSKIDFVIMCTEGQTSLYFNTGCHMTSSQHNRYGDIEYRIDSERSKTVSGKASSDSRALGVWGGSQSIPVIKSLVGKSKLLVRMMPYGERQFTASFSLAGIDDAVKLVRQACKW